VNAAILGLSDSAARRIDEENEAAWKQWENQCDFEERLHFGAMQFLAKLEVLRSGEVVAVRRMSDRTARGVPYLTSWLMVDPERMERPTDQPEETCRGGVEVGANGQPVAYWILREHPNDVGMCRWRSQKSDDYVRIPAYDADGFPNVLHIYHKERVGQNRGRPILAPVIQRIRDLSGYQEAEWIAARAAACIARIVTTPDPSSMHTANSTEGADGARYEEMRPGQTMYLAPGQQFESFTPTRPSGAYDAFIRSALQEIATAFNIPVQVLVNDWSDMSFAGGRLALLQAWKLFRYNQEHDKRRLCNPVWQCLIYERWLRGEINAPAFLAQRQLWSHVDWQGPTYEYLDPQKEATADIRLVKANLLSKRRVFERRGEDYDEETAEIAREAALEDELGIRQHDDNKQVPFYDNQTTDE
jgi:lambda family phage portal protein